MTATLRQAITVMVGNTKMPTVGKKHFKYTKKGVAAARSYARKTGKRVIYKKRGKTYCDARKDYAYKPKKRK